MKSRHVSRRAVVSGLGVAGAALAARPAGAQQASSPFRPTRHTQDAWMDGLPGQHRTIIDSVSPKGVSEALLFARNLYVANASGYGLKDADVAVVVCLRHQGTGLAFNDAMWAKYGATLGGSDTIDPSTGKTPVVNPYNRQGAGITIGDAVARGTHFAVCSMATGRLAGIIAKQAGTTQEAIVKELTSNLIPNGHMVAAGVVAVTRAQEYGYTLLSAG